MTGRPFSFLRRLPSLHPTFSSAARARSTALAMPEYTLWHSTSPFCQTMITQTKPLLLTILLKKIQLLFNPLYLRDYPTPMRNWGNYLLPKDYPTPMRTWGNYLLPRGNERQLTAMTQSMRGIISFGSWRSC